MQPRTTGSDAAAERNCLEMLFSQDIGIDLGTANTLICVRNKGIVIREPSVVAVDVRSNQQKVVAVGNEASRCWAVRRAPSRRQSPSRTA